MKKPNTITVRAGYIEHQLEDGSLAYCPLVVMLCTDIETGRTSEFKFQCHKSASSRDDAQEVVAALIEMIKNATHVGVQ